MGLNQTPASERIQIGFFGKCNAGKSSLINAITGQNLAIVSAIKGTTTDPVYKTMELLPLGPVMLIDTPGIDDEGELGSLRVKKSYQILSKIDIAVVVIDGTIGKTSADKKLLGLIQKKRIPCLIVYNKWDLSKKVPKKTSASAPDSAVHDSGNFRSIHVSACQNLHISELRKLLCSLKPTDRPKHPLIADLLAPADLVILVIPLDKSAPKGRLILPQQQTIRDILERGAYALTVRDTEFKQTLKQLLSRGIHPKLVVTDSQAFAEVSKNIPDDLLLTSFSILFARYKGDLQLFIQGISALSQIKDGDRILIAESCTHHRQCSDIGTVKIPAQIRRMTGKTPVFSFTSGKEFPENLSFFQMVIHCGGCMLTKKEMQYRISCCRKQEIPVTNYGILLAQSMGILKRSLEPFPEITEFLQSPRKKTL